MAKTFKLTTVNSIEGTPYKVPIYNTDGTPTVEEGKVKTKDGTLLDILDLMIKVFPRDRMTMENITHGSRLKTQLLNSTDGILVIEEAEHDWVKKMLKDDAVGPKLFGFSLVNIIDALDMFERREEKKDGS